MPNRAYVVEPVLLPVLEAELSRLGVSYRLIYEPEQLPGKGKDPRPVLVTEGPKPYGYVRFGRCRICKSPVKLIESRHKSRNGSVSESCSTPENHDWQSDANSEAAWARREMRAPLAELGLPAWLVEQIGFTGCGESAGTVYAVRKALREQTLRGVGREREAMVSEALRVWREKESE